MDCRRRRPYIFRMLARPSRGWKRILAGWLAICVAALSTDVLPAHACPRHGVAMAAAMGTQASGAGDAATHTNASAATADQAVASGAQARHHGSPRDTNRHPCTCPGQCCATPTFALTPDPLTWQGARLVEPLRSISAQRARITAGDPRLGLPFATAPPRA